MREILQIIAVGFHLIMVSLGAAFIDISEGNVVGKALNAYADASGANSGYSFFAPDVGTSLRARFESVLPSGQRVQHSLERGISHEADLRVDNIIESFWRMGEELRLQRSIVASWAGKMFARFPETKAVTVSVEAYALPSMDEFRNGVEPGWDQIYTATFERKGTQ